MSENYKLVFDKVMLKQLQKVGRNKEIKNILIRMLDKIEILGPLAGNLIDSKLNLYETKNKSLQLDYIMSMKKKQEKLLFLNMRLRKVKNVRGRL